MSYLQKCKGFKMSQGQSTSFCVKLQGSSHWRYNGNESFAFIAGMRYSFS